MKLRSTRVTQVVPSDAFVPGAEEPPRTHTHWRRWWQHRQRSFWIWSARLGCFLLIVGLSPLLLPFATLGYSGMAVREIWRLHREEHPDGKMLLLALSGILVWFVSASAWPFCTVWWLGPLGPAWVAWGHLVFWTLGVLVVLSFSLAHRKQLGELDWQLHDELEHLETDSSWWLHIFGILVDWYYFSSISLGATSLLETSLPGFVEDALDLFLSGQNLAAGERLDFALLAVNLLFAVFPAFYLVDRMKDHGLNFWSSSLSLAKPLAESYFAASVNSLFVLLVSWDLRLLACDENGVFVFLVGSCWDELHSAVAFIACLFVTSIVPMILPVTFGRDIIEDGDTVSDTLRLHPWFILVERPLKFFAVAVSVQGKALDLQRGKLLPMTLVALLLALLSHEIWTSNNEALNLLRECAFWSAFVNCFCSLLAYELRAALVSHSLLLSASLLLLGQASILLYWANKRGFDTLVTRADLKRLARRVLRCLVLIVLLNVTLGFLFFPQFFFGVTGLFDEPRWIIDGQVNISVDSCAIFVRSSNCTNCTMTGPDDFFAEPPESALARIYRAGNAAAGNGSLPSGHLLNDTALAGCDLWLHVASEKQHRIECKGLCTVRVEGEFEQLELVGDELEVRVDATLREEGVLSVKAARGTLWADLFLGRGASVDLKLSDADVVVDSNESVSACVSAGTACIEGLQTNGTCDVRFVGTQLRLRSQTTLESLVPGDMTLHGHNGTLEGVVTEGTQYVILTEGLGNAQYVLPSRGARYVIPPSQGLAGISPVFMALVSLNLFPSIPIERSFLARGCGRELDVARAVQETFPDKPIFVLSTSNPNEAQASGFDDFPTWWLLEDGFTRTGYTSWPLVVASVLLLTLSLALLVACIWGLRYSTPTVLRWLRKRVESVQGSRVQVLQTLLVQLLVVLCTREQVDKEDASLAEVALEGAEEELPDVVATYLVATMLEFNEADVGVRRRAVEVLVRQPRALSLAVDGLLEVLQDGEVEEARKAAEAVVSLGVAACTLAVKKLRQEAQASVPALAHLGHAVDAQRELGPWRQLREELLQTLEKLLLNQRLAQEHGWIAMKLRCFWGQMPLAQLLLRLRRQSLKSQSRAEMRSARKLIDYGGLNPTRPMIGDWFWLIRSAQEKVEEYKQMEGEDVDSQLEEQLEDFWDDCLLKLPWEEDAKAVSPEDAADLVELARRDLESEEYERAARVFRFLGPAGLGGANALVAALGRGEEKGESKALVPLVEALARLQSPSLPVVRELLKVICRTNGKKSELREETRSLHVAVAQGCFALKPPTVSMPNTVQELLAAHEAIEALGSAVARRAGLCRMNALGAMAVARMPPEEVLALLERRHSSGNAPVSGKHYDRCLLFLHDMEEVIDELWSDEQHEAVEATKAREEARALYKALERKAQIMRRAAQKAESIMGNVFGSVLGTLQGALLDDRASMKLLEELATGLVRWGLVALAPTIQRLQTILDRGDGNAFRAALALAALADAAGGAGGASANASPVAAALCGLQKCTAQAVEVLREVKDEETLWALTKLTRHDHVASLLRALRPDLAPQAVTWKELQEGKSWDISGSSFEELDALTELCQDGFVPPEAPKTLLAATLRATGRHQKTMEKERRQVGRTAEVLCALALQSLELDTSSSSSSSSSAAKSSAAKSSGRRCWASPPNAADAANALSRLCAVARNQSSACGKLREQLRGLKFPSDDFVQQALYFEVPDFELAIEWLAQNLPPDERAKTFYKWLERLETPKDAKEKDYKMGLLGARLLFVKGCHDPEINMKIADMKFLEHPALLVRQCAARAELAKTAGRSEVFSDGAAVLAIAELEQALSEAPAPALAAAAARSLVRTLHAAGGAERLGRILTHSFEEVRAVGMEAAVRLARGNGGMPLVLAAVKDRSLIVREKALLGLGKIIFSALKKKQLHGVRSPKMWATLSSELFAVMSREHHGEAQRGSRGMLLQQVFQLVDALPSPWTLLAAGVAYLVSSNNSPVADILRMPDVIVCNQPPPKGTVKLTQFWTWRLPLRRRSWWQRRKRQPFQQVLGPGQVSILKKAIQLFSLTSRLEVVEQPDLGTAELAAVFQSFGITFTVPQSLDGGGQGLILSSSAERPKLLNVEALEAAVWFGFMGSQKLLSHQQLNTSPPLPVLRLRWWLVDTLVVLAQVVLMAIISFMPLVWAIIPAMAGVPYYPVSPVTGLTVEHFGLRLAELTVQLLFAFPEVTILSFTVSGLLTFSLLGTYWTETLPLAPMQTCQALLQAVDGDVKWSGCRPFTWLMKLLPWMGILWAFYVISACATSAFCWMLFGLVVEPERFVALVSAIVSFVYTILSRLWKLIQWRRFLKEAIAEIMEKFMGPIWCSLLERISPHCSEEHLRRVMAGSDSELFTALLGEKERLTFAEVARFLAPLVDEATLLVLASHVTELQRSQQTAQLLTRETFKKLMEVVREHLIEFLVRKLGFDGQSVFSKMKYFTLVALAFFALLVVLLQLYTLKAPLSTVISGVLPALLGVLLQRPGRAEMPSDLKQVFEDFLESFQCGSRVILQNMRAAKEEFIQKLAELNATEEFLEAVRAIDVFSLAKALLNPAFEELLMAMINGQRNIKELFKQLDGFLEELSPKLKLVLQRQAIRSCQDYVLEVCSFLGDDVQAKIEEIFLGLNEADAAEKLMLLAQRLSDPSLYRSFQALLTQKVGRMKKGGALQVLQTLQTSLEDIAPGLMVLLQKKIICAALPLLDLETASVQKCDSSEALLDEVGRLALQKLRPALEPHLPRFNVKGKATIVVSWDAVLDLVALEGIHELVELLEDPTAFRRTMEKKLMRAVWRLVRQVVLEAFPADSPFKVLDLEEVIELVDSYEELKEAVEDPHSFLEKVLLRGGRAAKRLVLAQLQQILPPLLPQGIAWSEVKSELEKVDLRRLKGLTLPKLLEALEASEGAALAKKILLAQAWPMLQPRLPDTVTLEAMQFVVVILKPTAIKKAFDDPDAFLTSLTASPAAKRFILAQAQPLLRPWLPEGVAWGEVVPVLEQVHVEDIKEALTNPRGFLQSLEGRGRVAMQWVLVKAKPVLEFRLPKGVQWQLVHDLLLQLSIQEVLQAMKGPQSFFESLGQHVGPVAMKWAIAQLQPALQPLLPEGLDWQELETELLHVDLDTLKQSLTSPEELLQVLASRAGPFPAKLAIKEAKPLLQPFLPKGMVWSDAEAVLMMMELEDVKEGVLDPQRFLSSVAKRLGPAAQRWAVAQLRPLLSPHLAPLRWDDVEVILQNTDLEKLNQGLREPKKFLWSLVKSARPVAVKLAAKAWPQLLERTMDLPEPFTKENLKGMSRISSDDVEALLLEVKVETVIKVLENPEPRALMEVIKERLESPEAGQAALHFLAQLLQPRLQTFLPGDMLWEDVAKFLLELQPADLLEMGKKLAAGNVTDLEQLFQDFFRHSGRAALRWSLAKLRPRLESQLPRSVPWESLAQLLEDSAEGQVAKALADPQNFLKSLTNSTGELGSRWILLQLRPTLEMHLPEGIAWEDVEQQVAALSLEELRRALREPRELLQRLAAAPGARRLALARARTALEPLISMPWKHIESALLLLEVDDLAEALQDPATFLSELNQRRAGQVAQAWAVAQLRLKVEPLLPANVTWRHVEAALHETSLVELRQGLLEPSWFLDQLASRLRPLAIQLLISRAWPKLKQLLRRHLQRFQLGEEEALSELSLANLEEFRQLLSMLLEGQGSLQKDLAKDLAKLKKLKAFLKKELVEAENKATRRFLISLLKPHLVKLAPSGVAWDDWSLILEELTRLDLEENSPGVGAYEQLGPSGPLPSNAPLQTEYLARLLGFCEMSGHVELLQRLPRAALLLALALARRRLAPELPEALPWRGVQRLALEILEQSERSERSERSEERSAEKEGRRGGSAKILEQLQGCNQCTLEQLLVLNSAPAKWALQQLKPRIREVLPPGAYWPEVEEAVLQKRFSPSEVLALFEEPEKVLDIVQKQGTALARQILLQNLRKEWPTKFYRLGVEWKDAEAFLMDLKVEQLSAESFERLPTWALLQLKPLLLQVLEPMPWLEAEEELKKLGVGRLRKLLEKPSFEGLREMAAPLLQKLIIRRLRPQLKLPIDAPDLEAVLLDFSIEELQAAWGDASALQRLQRALTPGAATSRGRRLLAAVVKQKLRGELPEAISLEEVEPLLQKLKFEDLQDMHQASSSSILRLLDSCGGKAWAWLRLHKAMPEWIPAELQNEVEEQLGKLSAEVRRAGLSDPILLFNKLKEDNEELEKKFCIAEARPYLQSRWPEQALAWHDMEAVLHRLAPDKLKELTQATVGPEKLMKALEELEGLGADSDQVEAWLKCERQLYPKLSSKEADASDSKRLESLTLLNDLQTKLPAKALNLLPWRYLKEVLGACEDSTLKEMAENPIDFEAFQRVVWRNLKAKTKERGLRRATSCAVITAMLKRHLEPLHIGEKEFAEVLQGLNEEQFQKLLEATDFQDIRAVLHGGRWTILELRHLLARPWVPHLQLEAFLQNLSREEMDEALKDPLDFLEQLDGDASLLGEYERLAGKGLDWTLMQLQPAMEPFLPEGLGWQAVEVELRTVDLDLLKKGCKEPLSLLRELARRGVEGIRESLLITEVREKLQDLDVPKDLPWCQLRVLLRRRSEQELKALLETSDWNSFLEKIKEGLSQRLVLRRLYLPMMGAELERNLRILTASDLVGFLEAKDFKEDVVQKYLDGQSAEDFDAAVNTAAEDEQTRGALMNILIEASTVHFKDKVVTG